MVLKMPYQHIFKEASLLWGDIKDLCDCGPACPLRLALPNLCLAVSMTMSAMPGWRHMVAMATLHFLADAR